LFGPTPNPLLNRDRLGIGSDFREGPVAVRGRPRIWRTGLLGEAQQSLPKGEKTSKLWDRRIYDWVSRRGGGNSTGGDVSSGDPASRRLSSKGKGRYCAGGAHQVYENEYHFIRSGRILWGVTKSNESEKEWMPRAQGGENLFYP